MEVYVDLDTHNKEKKQYKTAQEEANDDNTTNDITIRLYNPRNRINVSQISLVSFEPSLCQYTVESDGNQLVFDEGLDLLVFTSDGLPFTQLVIQENGIDYTAQLMPGFNPINTADTSTPGEVTFTTDYPHGLEIMSAYTWNEFPTLVSTPITDPAFTVLTPDNPNLEIITDNSFRILNLPGPVTFSPLGPVNGYIRAPVIPGPTQLCDLLTAALENVLPSHWQVGYDRQKSRYWIRWIGSVSENRSINSANLVISSEYSLAYLMGFGVQTIALNVPALVNNYTEIDRYRFDQTIDERGKLASNTTIAHYPPTYTSSIAIDPANYQANELIGNLNRQLNRLYFDPGPFTTSTPFTVNSAYVFAYSDPNGILNTFNIPFGKYTPNTFCNMLNQMVQLNPTMTSFIAAWDDVNNRFTFSCTLPFGLEFDQGTSDLAYRLGFYPISYRGLSYYVSKDSLTFPTKCWMSGRYLEYNYTPLVIGNKRLFQVEVSNPRTFTISVTVSSVVDNGDGTIVIVTDLGPTGTIPFSHGYQVNDFVNVYVLPGGDMHTLMVSDVTSYNELTMDIGAIDPTVFTAATTLSFSLNGVPHTNLYLGDPQLTSPTLAQTMGFMTQDILWAYDSGLTTSSFWLSNSCYFTDFPNYLLLELVDPEGQTLHHHQWDKNVRPRILAKCILNYQGRIERPTPMTLYTPDLKMVDRVRVRLLNPDHTLYKMHNRHWSFTLCMRAIEKNVQQLAM